ncbi:MAG: TRAP transporter small permease subunit [Pseudomonadales bacterium]
MPALNKRLHQFEDLVLVTALLSMLAMALLQILLRNFFDAGIFWAESFLRILVLWVAMLGAMVATRNAGHLSIDAASRFLPLNFARWISTITNLFSSAICCVVAYYALEFVKFEFEDKTIAFGVVPSWVCQSILPFGFAIMSFRFLVKSLQLAWFGRLA